MRLAALLILIAAGRLLAADGRDSDIALHTRRAQEAIRQNRSDEAIRELQALLRIDPANVNAIASLGMVLFTKGDYTSAAGQFETALQRSPSLWSAAAFLGMCELRLGRAGRGRERLEQSFPHVADRHLRVQSGLALVQAYSAAGTLEKAIPVLETLHQIDPDSPEILYTTYRVNSEIAAAALHKLTVLDSDSLWVHEILAQNHMAQEQYAQAIVEYRKALARDPHALGLHYQLGEALLNAARSDENRAAAEEEFLAELERNPADADSLNKLGQIAMGRAEASKAQQYFRHALELRPELAEAHAALGALLEKQGDRGGAITQYETAAKLAPDAKTNHYRLAQLYKLQGRPADSERELALYRKLSQAAQSPSLAPPAESRP
ncbi:MAG: tetratricopeptide repeat protein [Bryobacteraceae bacterium]